MRGGKYSKSCLGCQGYPADLCGGFAAKRLLRVVRGGFEGRMRFAAA